MRGLSNKEWASRASDVTKARRVAYERECQNPRERWPEAIGADPYLQPQPHPTARGLPGLVQA